jgi:hypothetical protein
LRDSKLNAISNDVIESKKKNYEPKAKRISINLITFKLLKLKFLKGAKLKEKQL